MLTSGTRELKSMWDSVVGSPYTVVLAAALGLGGIYKINEHVTDVVNQELSACTAHGGTPHITTHYKRRPTVDCQMPEPPASAPQ